MKLFVFIRMQARAGCEADVEHAIRAVLEPSRQEPGCLAIDGFRSTHNRQLFFIHSRWTDEPAFDRHAALLHTIRFIERVDPLLEQPREVCRTALIG